MSNNSLELLALPDPTEHQCSDKSIKTAEPLQRKRIAVYGSDLNTSDLLLVGANQPLRKILVDEYSIGGDFSWEYPAAFSTTSRKVIVDDRRNQYFIKEKPKYCCSQYNLALSAQFQEFLASRTDFVPPIVHTASGNTYLQVGGALFFTTEFRAGRMFNSSLEDVGNAGAALGTIHSLSQEFCFLNPKNLHASDDALQFVDLANQLKGAENDPWRNETINALRVLVDKYRDRLDRDVSYIANHGDYAPFNLVYDLTGKIIAVNDFDNVNFRPRTRDLAGATISFCDGLSYAGATSSLRKPIASTSNLEKAAMFIRGYVMNAPALSEKEKSDLIGEACIRWVKIMALGIVRGDFNYEDVFRALVFPDFMEKHLPALI